MKTQAKPSQGKNISFRDGSLISGNRAACRSLCSYFEISDLRPRNSKLHMKRGFQEQLNHHSLPHSPSLVRPANLRPATRPNHQSTPLLLSNLLSGVPAPHGRWSLRLVKRSRQLATRPSGDLTRQPGQRHALESNELPPLSVSR